MNAPLKPGAVLRRTIAIYAEHAAFVLQAGVAVGALVALAGIEGRRPLWLGIVVLVLGAIALGLFVSVLALLVADVRDGGQRRDRGALLVRARVGLGQVLLVGFLGSLALTLISSISSLLVFGLTFSLLFSNGAGGLGIGLAVALVAIPSTCALELFLITGWVSGAVAALEHPGGARALGRSRALVRGSGWRVLAVVLMILVPLTLITSVAAAAIHHLDPAAQFASRLLLGTVLAPIPVLAFTVVYFELLRSDPEEAVQSDPLPPSPLPVTAQST